MPSVFTRIIRGEIPCYQVAENEHYMAFLDINPLQKGHTLVVPKQETDYIFDLEDKVLSGLFVFAKEVAGKIEKVFPCDRIGITVIGLEVPHAHVHLIPIHEEKDMNFSGPKMVLSAEEMLEIAQRLSEA